MCEMAEEIQKQAPDLTSSSNQFFYCSKDEEMLTEDCGYMFCPMCISGSIKQKEDYIWLPRQDQLQAMVSDNPLVLTENIHNLLFNEPGGVIYSTMEQLWLGFVMKYRHKKKWDGEKWAIMKL